MGIRRRPLIAIGLATLSGSVDLLRAQAAGERVWRVGVLSLASSNIQLGVSRWLRESGYEEGRNVVIVYRSAKGDPAALPGPCF